jgi:hypothetical protein
MGFDALDMDLAEGHEVFRWIDLVGCVGRSILHTWLTITNHGQSKNFCILSYISRINPIMT